MNSIETELRSVLIRHGADATPPQLLRFTSTLLGQQPEPPAASPAVAAPRFVHLDAQARATDDDACWIATYDRETKLIWLADPVPGGDRNWEGAQEAAQALRIFGSDRWTGGTLKQFFSILDHDRFGPALLPGVLKGPYTWTWTATRDAERDAESPSACAWVVDLRDGVCTRIFQSSRGSVRAVLASDARAVYSEKNLAAGAA